MEITVLASGSSGNCYHVSDMRTPLLLEAGIRFKEIQEGTHFTVSYLGGCLISHEHLDHSKAVKDLMKAGVDCYASPGTWAALGIGGGHRAHQVVSEEQFNIGSWAIMPFETEHDAAEPLGFLLASGGEKILYATDTGYIRYKFRGLTRLMIECNYSLDTLRENVAGGDVPMVHKNRVMRSHMSLDTLLDFFDANDLSRVREIYLLHMSDGNADEEEIKRRVQERTGKVVYVA